MPRKQKPKRHAGDTKKDKKQKKEKNSGEGKV